MCTDMKLVAGMYKLLFHFHERPTERFFGNQEVDFFSLMVLLLKSVSDKTKLSRSYLLVGWNRNESRTSVARASPVFFFVFVFFFCFSKCKRGMAVCTSCTVMHLQAARTILFKILCRMSRIS